MSGTTTNHRVGSSTPSGPINQARSSEVAPKLHGYTTTLSRAAFSVPWVCQASRAFRIVPPRSTGRSPSSSTPRSTGQVMPGRYRPAGEVSGRDRLRTAVGAGCRGGVRDAGGDHERGGDGGE